MSGQIALFSIYFVALFVHELGHIILAKCLHVELKRCTIYPFGGQISFQQEWQIEYWKKALIACGGPLASGLCLVFAQFLPPLVGVAFYKINFYLLILNLIPILPLDGGRIALHWYLHITRDIDAYAYYLSLSISILLIFGVYFLLLIPKSTIICFVTFFLLLSIFPEWRVRKYRLALEKKVKKQLT